MVRPARAALALLALAAPAAARAELVLLVDGAVVKVDAYAADDREARLTLPGGGTISMPVMRVDRVLEDEIVPQPEATSIGTDPPAFAVRFADDQVAPAVPFAAAIFDVSRRQGLNPVLVSAVIRAESGFDARAVSNKGARGLMQLMPSTGRRYGLRPVELYDPLKNLEAGARYLRFLADRFADDLPRILAGYNAGEGSVDRYRGVPPYRETVSYIRRVYSFLGLELAAAPR
jgi:hypothetical protein